MSTRQGRGVIAVFLLSGVLAFAADSRAAQRRVEAPGGRDVPVFAKIVKSLKKLIIVTLGDTASVPKP